MVHIYAYGFLDRPLNLGGSDPLLAKIQNKNSNELENGLYLDQLHASFQDRFMMYLEKTSISTLVL